MPTRFQLLGIGLAVVIAGAVVALTKNPQSIRAKPQPAVPEHELTATPPESAPEPSGYEKEVETHIQALTKLQAAKARRDQAAAQTPEARRFLQTAYRSQWLKVLETNWPAFLQLRHQAAKTPTRETPCTLCDGNGSASFCILCPERVGKCVTCQGTGRMTAEQICPTCLGNGQCYLCFGSGKMLCPFCNNGMIEFRRPLPSSLMPTN